jgi:hypothetical protein
MRREYIITVALSTISREEGIAYIMSKFKHATVEVKNSTRTDQQNKSLHLLFSQLATELKDKHIPIYTILSKRAETEWTPTIVKEIWRDIQKAMFDKKSTKQLFKTMEIEQIYDVMNRMIIEATHGEVTVVPFPSYESQLNNSIE